MGDLDSKQKYKSLLKAWTEVTSSLKEKIDIIELGSDNCTEEE